MAASNWTIPNSARTSWVDGTFDWDTDTFKVALFLSTSNLGPSSTTYAALTNEHANANGYTTGGVTVTISLSGTTTVTCDFSADPQWTASGGDIVARYAVVYESGGNIAMYCELDDTPADVTCSDGNTITIQLPGTGLWTLS